MFSNFLVVSINDIYSRDSNFFADGYWLKQFINPYNIFMFYLSLHAILPLLMLQINRTGITFIYIVRFEGDR